MHRHFRFTVLTVTICIVVFQVEHDPAFGREPPAPTTQPATREADGTAGPSRADLERQLAETLSGSVLAGSWHLIEGDQLGEARPDKYTIVKAQKLSADFWLITARIQYADKDVTVPLPLRILWAGDTPVITVSDLAIPGIGTYSARVMIHRNLYSGTWFGVGYSGVMSGMITKAAESAPAAAEQAP